MNGSGNESTTFTASLTHCPVKFKEEYKFKHTTVGPPGSTVPDTVEATDLLDLVSSLELPECLLIPPRETTPESLPPYKNIDIVLDYPSTDW